MKPICGTTVARKKARAGKEDKVRKENTTYLYLCLSYFQCLRNFWSLCAVFLTHTTCDWFFVFLVGLGMSFPMKRWFLVYLGKPYYSCTMTKWINTFCHFIVSSSHSKNSISGGYDLEEKAARAYDLAALKYWGPSTHINFPVMILFALSSTLFILR